MEKSKQRMFKRSLLFTILFGMSNYANAAFVESAIGHAIINDASAVYYNPASLTLLPNKQIVAEEDLVSVLSTFKGTTIQTATGYTQTGAAYSRTYYSLPSFYLGIPINDRITIGFGQLYNFFGRGSYPATSIMRYFQTYTFVSTLDLMGSIGVKVTKTLSLGAGLGFQYGRIDLNGMVGFPTLGVPDAKSINEANAKSIGGNLGLLYTPFLGTLIGLTYHSPVSYDFSGRSVFMSTPSVTTNTYKIKAVTPPSIVLSVSQFVSPQLGFIATLQRMNWATVQNLNLQNVAFRVGPTPVIIPSVNKPYLLHNTWRLMLGSQYQVNPKWLVRAGGAYDEDPNNPYAQLTPGANIILAVGSAYNLSKHVTLDVTYAHIFYQAQNQNITSAANLVQGVITGGRDALLVKAIINFV